MMKREKQRMVSEKYLRKMKADAEDRIIKIMERALKEEFGFGEKRMDRLAARIERIALEETGRSVVYVSGEFK